MQRQDHGTDGNLRVFKLQQGILQQRQFGQVLHRIESFHTHTQPHYYDTYVYKNG